jgi:hypothetical protein
MNGPESLKPVLDFLDALIAEHGHILYMVLVYISLPLIAWILSGGLRRRLSHRENAAAPPIIVIWRTSPPPSPPDIVGDYRPPANDDEQSFDA